MLFLRRIIHRKMKPVCLFKDAGATHASSGDFPPRPQDTRWRRPLLHFSCLVSVNSGGGVSKKRSPGLCWGAQVCWQVDLCRPCVGSLGKSWAALLWQSFYTTQRKRNKKHAAHRGGRANMLLGDEGVDYLGFCVLVKQLPLSTQRTSFVWPLFDFLFTPVSHWSRL